MAEEMLRSAQHDMGMVYVSKANYSTLSTQGIIESSKPNYP